MGWIRIYPESVENTLDLQQAKARLSCDAMKHQMNAGFSMEFERRICLGRNQLKWFCNGLAKIAKPTLV
jgi:hypothetical protein